MRIRQGRRRSIRKLTGPVVLLSLLALVMSACTDSADETTAIDRNPITELIKPKLVAQVQNGDVGISPVVPMKFGVEDGRFTNVALLTPEGTPVDGAMAPDNTSWSNTESLGYDRTYQLVVEAIGLGGATKTSLSFTTTAPDNKTKPYLVPGEGEVVGVAQPVAIQFDEPIPDRKAAQDSIEIKTDPGVEGAFYWVNNREVRWRPEHFWKPGTKVDVDVEVYGKDLGNGLYGQDDIHSSFTIGDAVVFTADDATKQVVVERNGEVIRTMPTSMGKDDTPTDNGVYIVGDKHREIIMDSSTFGVAVDSSNGYRTPVEYATRISYSGIFFHAAPWSVGQQGSTNASHGCLNLSDANARWVFETAKRGDPTIIRNTVGGTLSGVDGLGDWNIPWEQWKAGNADIS